MNAPERNGRACAFELRGHPLTPAIIAALPGLFARSFRTHGRSHYAPREIEAALSSDDGSGYALFRSGTGLVALLEGRPVGCGALGSGETGAHGAARPAQEGAAGIASVRAFCTDPEFAGHGIGKALMEGLFALAEKHGVTELRLTATLSSAGFYRKCGFTAEKKIQIPCADGISVAAIPMTCRLR